jgi:hypothetical protein
VVHLDSESIDRVLDAVQDAIRGDSTLAADLHASRSDFFPGAAPAGVSGEEARLAERRHLEWFLAERCEIGLHEDRLAALLERCAAEAGVDPVELTSALLSSHASLFEVTAVEPGRGMELWDLAGLFPCDAAEPAGSRALAVGDLIAGRVFPIGAGLYHVSRAAGSWRSAKLLAALKKDFERVRTERAPTSRGTLRLRESEIESMFHARDGSPEAGITTPIPKPGAVARARELLRTSGLSPEDAADVIAGLAQEAPDPARILPGGRDVLGEILDTLAFETSIDLDAARAVLLEAWDELHAPGASAPPAAEDPAPARGPAVDVGTAVAEFDRKRLEGTPLEQALRELERDLDLDPDDGSDDLEEDGPAPDFPGVVEAMVEEFLWDEGRERGLEAAQRCQSLRGLGRSAADVTVFESLGPRELIDFAGRWVFDVGGLRDPEDAAALVECLARFCRWAEENHDVPIATSFAPALARLRASLPRLASANRACPPGVARGNWYQLVHDAGGDRGEFEDLDGAPTTFAVAPGILPHLRPGDLVRGQPEQGAFLAVASCHPAELREVLGA